MKPQTAVFALADFEPATHAAAQALAGVAGELEALGWRVELLRGPEATPENLVEAVSRLDPALVLGEGHGSREVFTLQDKRVALRVCSGSWVAGRLVFLQSCETAAELGPDLVSKGVLAYLGYSRDFLWVQEDASANPLEDPFGRLFWEPVRLAVLALGSGRSAGEAYGLAAGAWRGSLEDVRTWLDPAAPLLMLYLRNDLEAWRLLGDPSLRLAPPRRLPVAEEVPIASILGALLPPAILAGVILSAKA